MALLDWTLILDYVISLAIVALPVEAAILLTVRKFRRLVSDTLTSPEKRAELIHEVAAQVWAPLKEPESRKNMIHEVALTLWEPLSTPEKRQHFISELGHGVLRAVREQSGSLAGAAARQQKAGMLDAALEGGNALGVLGALPSKIELPIIASFRRQRLQLEARAASRNWSAAEQVTGCPSGSTHSSSTVFQCAPHKIPGPSSVQGCKETLQGKDSEGYQARQVRTWSSLGTQQPLSRKQESL